MDTCTSCGATLGPGADWCTLCYARVRPGPSDVPMGPASAVMPGVSQASVGQGSAPAPAAPPVPAGRLGWTPEAPEHVPEYSRLKAGPNSFGVIGRTMLSIGLLIGLVVGYFALIGNVGITPDWHSAALYTAASPVVAIPVLYRIWRPSRIK